MRWLAVLAILATPASADNARTLADLRQDISVLQVELQRLTRELSTTGGTQVAVSGTVLDRVVSIEETLMRLTAKVENLENRIGTVVSDGTNRLGDLEFRVCEVDPTCDIGSLGATRPLGGETPMIAPTPPAETALPSGGVELAVSEEADFRDAMAAFDAGDFDASAKAYALFREIYPGSPLEPAALLGEGKSLNNLGDTREAARRFLAVFSDYPQSEIAPEALWRLGNALASLGSLREACIMLDELPGRYPQSQYVAQAAQSRGDLSCS